MGWHRKINDKRKEYTGAKAFSRSCRNCGSCSWCRSNRMIDTKKLKEKSLHDLKDFFNE